MPQLKLWGPSSSRYGMMRMGMCFTGLAGAVPGAGSLIAGMETVPGTARPALSIPLATLSSVVN